MRLAEGRLETESPGVHPLIGIRGLTKRFTGTLAVDRVSMDVHAGQIHALLGENGAGKSTLIKMLAGVYAPDAGEITWRGQVVDPAAHRLPVSFIHQDLGLVESMTVAENIALVTGYPRRAGRIAWRRVREVAKAVLAQLAVEISPDTQVARLSSAERSLVAIARALAVESDALVLDEPTAALPEADVSHLFAALRQLRSKGMAIVYVTHRLDEVFRLADRVTVLRDGRRVLAQTVSQTTPGGLVQAIVGRPLKEVFVRPDRPAERGLLALRTVVTADGVGPVTLRLHEGEILGLVGLRGAGHTAVGRVIFGDLGVLQGTIEFGGEGFRPGIAAAIRRGLAFVSSQRGEEGLASGLAVRENLFMNPAPRGAMWRIISAKTERDAAGDLCKRFDIRPPDSERVVATLSGGNQQKVLLARWLGQAESRLLILEEPTFGVDVGSKAQIYGMLHEFTQRGGGVLLTSSDFEEVAGVCNRAIVFSRGRMVADLPRGELSVATLTSVAGGAETTQAETGIRA